MDVSVILVNYNSSKLLEQCLASIFNHTRDLSVEVIVVDNASQDDSVSMVRSNFQGVRLIEVRENVGFSRSNNIGAQAAQGRYILFLNTDTLFKENSVKILANFLNDHTDIGAVGPSLCFENGRYQISCGNLPNVFVEFVDKIRYSIARNLSATVSPILKRMNNKTRTVGWLTGACLMVRREAFEQVGGFDENMFMYFEDKDLCKRIAEAGWRVVYYPVTSVVHALAGSSRSIDQQDVKRIYRKSQVYYYHKHLGRAQTNALHWYLKLTGKG